MFENRNLLHRFFLWIKKIFFKSITTWNINKHLFTRIKKTTKTCSEHAVNDQNMQHKQMNFPVFYKIKEPKINSRFSFYSPTRNPLTLWWWQWLLFFENSLSLFFFNKLYSIFKHHAKTIGKYKCNEKKICIWLNFRSIHSEKIT